MEAVPAAPPAVVTFDSTNFDTNIAETGSAFIPPDPHAAAGTTHVVDVTNVVITAFTKAGVLAARESLADFFSALGPQTFTFDPKVLWDQFEDRFVVVTLEQLDGPPTVSKIFLAVSDTADPTAGWNVAEIDAKVVKTGADGMLERWFDYPGFALDEEAIYLTGNMFCFAADAPCGGAGADLYIIDKGVSGGFYDGMALSATRFDLGTDRGGWQPAHVFGTAPAGIGTWLTTYSGLSNGVSEFVTVNRIGDPLGTPTFTRQDVNIGNIEVLAGALPDAPQSGTMSAIEVNDRRTLNAVWRSDRLFTTTTIEPKPGDPGSGEAQALWWEFDTTSLPVASLAQTAQIGGEDIAVGAFTFFPWIAVNDQMDKLIVFSSSAPSIFAGSYYTTQRAGDPAGSNDGSTPL
ncbi:MAG: hemolysin, partial [Actinobacteria bacterium]|nr:hemolysin [Actinomycetota bacterium]